MSDVPANDPAYTPIPGIAPEVDLGPELPASGPTTVIHGDRNVTYTQPEVVTPHLQAADYPSNSGIYNKEDAARAAGYSWNEIDQHIGPAQVAAQDAGYTQDEINQYLGFASPDAMVSRNTQAWAQVQHYDPKTLQPASDGTLDLTANPNWKGDYAAALLRGEVKGPKDFADQYAASAITASGAKNPQLLAAGAAGADQMAAQLPGRRDLTDAALSLGGAFDVAKQNLMDHWEETGQSPLDAAIKAQTNPALNAKLTTQPAPNIPWWAVGDPEAQAAADVSMAIAPAISDAFHRYADWRFSQPDANVSWGDWKKELKSNPDELTNLAFGVGGGAIERVGKPLVDALFPKITEALDRLPEPKTQVIDLAKPPGEAVTQVPVSEALKPVEAATRPLVVAARDNETGEVFLGKPGQIHADLVENPAHAEMGFADQSGKFLTREEAFNSLNAREQTGLKVQGELDAADYALNAKFENAPPAEKLQALAQEVIEPNTKANMQGVLNEKADQLETMRLTREGHLPDEFDRPNFFQNLAKNEDPATQELAKGYDAASGLARFFQQTLPNLFTEEKGAVPVGLGQVPKTLNPDEVAPGSLLAYRTGQNAAETLVRRYSPGRARAQIAYTTSQLDPMRAKLAPHVPEWMDSLEDWKNDRPGVAPWDTTIGKIIGHMENVPGFAMAKDDPFRPVADQLRELNDWKYRWLQDAADRGLMPDVNYVEGYWRHLWEDPNKASRYFGSGTQGSGATLKQRTIPTMFDGLKEGLIPAEKDPLNLVLRDLSSSFRHIASLDILQQAKDLNWVREPRYAEPTDVPLTGIGARRIIPLTDAVTGEPAGHTVGNLMAHPGFANIYNNWAGMIDKPLSKTEQFLGRIKNTALGYYLAVPIFHAWNILQIVGGGGFGRMWRDILHNEYGNAAIDLGKASTVAWPAVETYKAGQAFKKGYLKFGGMEPGQISDDPLISAIVAAGGGASKESTEILRPGMGPNWITAARQGMLKNQLREQWMRVTGPWKHDVFTKDAAGNPVINVGAMPNAVMAMPSTALDLIGEATGAISAPLFEHTIPILKDGANMRAAEEVLRRGAQNGTDPNLVALQIRQVVKNTDDRMGEMLHENLFWSRGLKRFANLTMLSVNWIYGEVRQTAAALGIQLQGKGTHWAWNEHAATNLVGTLTLAALIGGMYTWLKTGTAPKDPMDFIVPRTGATQKGVPVRVLLPGGQKEFLDWGKIAANTIAAGQDDGAQAAIMAATTGSADYLFGKRNNMFGVIGALASGKEYPGGPEIAHEPGQLEGYLMRELVTPISAQTTMNPIPGTSALERFLTAERRASVLEENFPRWRSTTKYFNQKADTSEISRARSQLNRQVGE